MDDSQGVYNVGSGHAESILSVASIVKEKLDYRGEIVWDAEKPNGQLYRMLDSSRAIGEGIIPEHLHCSENNFSAQLDQTIKYFLDKKYF